MSTSPPSPSDRDRDLRELLRTELKRHRRVVAQGFVPDEEAAGRLASVLPPIVPFGAQKYVSGLWILDWDHRLPSRHLTLRLYAFYSEERRAEAYRAVDTREQDMAEDDVFPEFDVPDYANFPADESYEAELDIKGQPQKLRLVSEFRRQVTPSKGQKAVEVVRAAESFKTLSQTMKDRPVALGDLEPAEWVPPCESGHKRWGIDVWYLMKFNGLIGEGRAYLVDIEDTHVVSERDFQFRVGPG